MSTYPEPVALLVYKNNKHHYSKRELAERERKELKIFEGDMTAPAYLTKKQKESFDYYVGMLEKIGIVKEPDKDCLARYVIAQENYILLTKKMNRILRSRESDLSDLSKLSGLQDKAFNQAHKCATAMGLTITSRCRLVVPGAPEGEDDEL